MQITTLLLTAEFVIVTFVSLWKTVSLFEIMFAFEVTHASSELSLIVNHHAPFSRSSFLFFFFSVSLHSSPSPPHHPHSLTQHSTFHTWKRTQPQPYTGRTRARSRTPYTSWTQRTRLRWRRCWIYSGIM